MADVSTSGTASGWGRAVRVAGWVLLGIGCGVVLGFAAGLARPRPLPSQTPDGSTGPDVHR